ncbi:MAG TPA: hypothetical protein VH370_23840 [Humisphaera sp.]|nr:hypothetical protein [Humisphaera sp.]
MADRARKKELKRLKRREKARQLHKAHNVPPVRQVAMSGAALECWINANWREQGIASLLVLGHARGGSHVFAAFLIDIWCVGLKDAYGQNGVSRLDFEKDILKRANEAMPMIRFDATKARQLVASSMRFSRQNGFKLPAHYDRWAAIFGDLGDISSADLSSFGRDGKLFYMGTREFLQQRLIGTTPDEFLSRPDLQWTMPQGRPDEFAEYFEEDEDEFDDEELEAPHELRQFIEEATERGAAIVRQWCTDNGHVPHPRLEEAMFMFVSALAASSAPVPIEGVQRTDVFESFVKLALSLPDVVDRDTLTEAVNQVAMAVSQLPPETLKGILRERPDGGGENRRIFTPSTVVDPVHHAGHHQQD